MASWKDGKGQYLWGTYSNIGNYYKVYAFGGPGGGDSNYFYVPSNEMDRLRSKNYGTGIHFWWEGSSLKITINLIIVSAKSDYQYVQGNNVRYVGDSNTDYEFLADIQYQTTDGSWHKLGDYSINTHHGGEPLYPSSGWDSGSGYLWNTFTFPNVDVNNIKQFGVGIHGSQDDVGNWVYYPIEVIKPVATTPKKVNVTVKYVDRDTYREIAQQDSYTVDKGSLYRADAKNVYGYTPEEYSTQIRAYNDVVYTFYYRRDRQYRDVVVEYIDSSTGRELLQSKTIYRQEVGSFISESYQPISGYTVDSTYKTLSVNSYNNTIRFYYTRNVTYIRPWAIRNSGSWKSFITNNIHMSKRHHNSWERASTDISTEQVGQVIPRDPRFGYVEPADSGIARGNYIRKDGSWKRQGKIGS